MQLPIHELGRQLARTIASLERSKDPALLGPAHNVDRAFFGSTSTALTGHLRELLPRLEDLEQRNDLSTCIAQLPTDQPSWDAMSWAYRDERMQLRQTLPQ